ncbi:MAG: type II toxin-antitoxin system CcdA family antitoxin [Rhodospirillales bacterium]|jgi:post-segregation antitoxin (ccd killing protein)
MGKLERTVVPLSLDSDTVSEASRYGVDLPEVATRAIKAEIERQRLATLRERIDRTMEYWNRLEADSEFPTVADEFGTL